MNRGSFNGVYKGYFKGSIVGFYTGFWSTILEYFFLVPVPLRNNYEIKVYTFFSLVTSKPSIIMGRGFRVLFAGLGLRV